MNYSGEHHPASPSIFISSTVEEFRDLRFAMAYVFRKLGYIVSQSEADDFNVSGNRSAIEECFNNIRNSDYYILLIGDKTGHMLENDISITRCEYRVAKESFLNTGKPILHLYLRQETDIALKKNNENKIKGFDNPTHQRAFIYEVQNPSNELVPNYLKRFNNSESLLNSLEFPLNLGRNLTERLARHSLISELLSNLAKMVQRHRSSAFPIHEYMERIRKEYPITEDLLNDDIYIPMKLSSRLVLALAGRIQSKDLLTQAIEDAINRGIFLKYDPQSGNFLDSPLHNLLKQTINDIRNINYFDSENLQSWDRNILDAIKQQRMRQSPNLAVNGNDYFYALAHYDRATNIFNEHKAMCRYLLGVTETLEEIVRKPMTPLGEQEVNNILKERVSEDEIARLIRNNIYPFGARVTQDIYGVTREEQFKVIISKLKAEIEKAGIKDMPCDVLKDIADIYLDAGAPPEDGIERR
jgi:hypothetical protein